jgi:hypothetical protein
LGLQNTLDKILESFMNILPRESGIPKNVQFEGMLLDK